jgi:hypothetical protein
MIKANAFKKKLALKEKLTQLRRIFFGGKPIEGQVTSAR